MGLFFYWVNLQQWEWSNQDGHPGNVGTVTGGGGGEGWYTVEWDRGSRNTYQYQRNHMDIIRYSDLTDNYYSNLIGPNPVGREDEEEEELNILVTKLGGTEAKGDGLSSTCDLKANVKTMVNEGVKQVIGDLLVEWVNKFWEALKERGYGTVVARAVIVVVQGWVSRGEKLVNGGLSRVIMDLWKNDTCKSMKSRSKLLSIFIH